MERSPSATAPTGGPLSAVVGGASVVVDQPTVVYQLTHAAIRRMETEHPALAQAFHKFVIRTLASRLDFANREVAALQR